MDRYFSVMNKYYDQLAISDVMQNKGRFHSRMFSSCPELTLQEELEYLYEDQLNLFFFSFGLKLLENNVSIADSTMSR